ncbi:MAG: hypothetical protein ACP5JG_06960, partial [Anaerolineae bacterium]
SPPAEVAEPPAQAPSSSSGTVPQLGAHTPPTSEQGFAQPPQVVPSSSQYQDGAYEAAPPIQRRPSFPRWVLWVAGGVALVAVVVIAVVLLLGVLGDEPSSAPEASPVAAVTATSTTAPAGAGSEPTAVPTDTPAPTATATVAPTDSPAPESGMVGGELYLEIGLSPSAPRVGRPLLVTVALVNDGEEAATADAYDLPQNGAPFLTFERQLPVDTFSGILTGVEGLPAVLVFTADQVGETQIQVSATVTFPDGTTQDIVSDPTTVRVRE